MIKVARIGHITLETPDTDRLINYYSQIIGLSIIHQNPTATYLACPGDFYSVVIQKGPVSKCSKLSLQVGPDADLDQAEATLRKEGCVTQRSSDSSPSIPDSLTFYDPSGIHVELYRGLPACGLWTELSGGVRPDRLGHVAFFVKDVKKLVAFYTRVLGFRVSDWNGEIFAFLRCSPDHHTVNFHENDETRLHHMAFEVRDLGKLRDSADCLARHKTKILWGPLRLGAGHNIATYHRNPDDQLVELFAEMDKMSSEELGYFDPRPWHEDNPQRPKVWSEKEPNSLRWGIQRPANQRY